MRVSGTNHRDLVSAGAPVPQAVRVAAFRDVYRSGWYQPVRAQAGVRHFTFCEVTDQWQVHFDRRVGQAEEEESTAVDAALIATGRLTQQKAEVILLHCVGELKGRRTVLGVYKNNDSARIPCLPRQHVLSSGVGVLRSQGAYAIPHQNGRLHQK